jgi:hypothetical protein
MLEALTAELRWDAAGQAAAIRMGELARPARDGSRSAAACSAAIISTATEQQRREDRNSKAACLVHHSRSLSQPSQSVQSHDVPQVTDGFGSFGLSQEARHKSGPHCSWAPSQVPTPGLHSSPQLPWSCPGAQMMTASLQPASSLQVTEHQ